MSSQFVEIVVTNSTGSSDPWLVSVSEQQEPPPPPPPEEEEEEVPVVPPGSNITTGNTDSLPGFTYSTSGCPLNRKINLTNYLPGHFEDTGTYQLVEFFETVLNDLYTKQTSQIITQEPYTYNIELSASLISAPFLEEGVVRTHVEITANNTSANPITYTVSLTDTNITEGQQYEFKCLLDPNSVSDITFRLSCNTTDSSFTFNEVTYIAANFITLTPGYTYRFIRTGTSYEVLGGIDTSWVTLPTTTVDTTCPVGILQKIENLATLHDPATIDIEFIGQLVSFLGYPLDQDFASILYFQKNKLLARSDIETLSREDLQGQIVVDDDYSNAQLNGIIRHMVTELPSWYRIKGTYDLVKVLLYTYGLIGELVERWTSEENVGTQGYSNDNSFWYDRTEGSDIKDIPDGYFPTPHFWVNVDVTNAPAFWLKNVQQLISSVDQVKPLNTVFENISALFKAPMSSFVVANTYDIVEYFAGWDGDPFGTPP